MILYHVSILIPDYVGSVHKGSALSPYLFIMLMEYLLTGAGEQIPKYMLFTDDIAQAEEDHVDLETRLGHLQQALQRIKQSSVYGFPAGGREDD